MCDFVQLHCHIIRKESDTLVVSRVDAHFDGTILEKMALDSCQNVQEGRSQRNIRILCFTEPWIYFPTSLAGGQENHLQG